MCNCTGFLRLGFGSREGNGGDVCSSWRSCYKFPPCPVEPMAADSKMEPPLAKVKVMSDCGSTLGKTHLRRGVFKWFKRRVRCVKEARERKCFRHQSRDPRNPWQSTRSRYSPATCGGSCTGRGGCPKKAMFWEAHVLGFTSRSVPEILYPMGGAPSLSQNEESSPEEETTAKTMCEEATITPISCTCGRGRG